MIALTAVIAKRERDERRRRTFKHMIARPINPIQRQSSLFNDYLRWLRKERDVNPDNP